MKTPSQLAAEALLDVDVYSLARVIQSEAPSSLPRGYALAVGEVVVNEAKHRGVSITKLVTTDTRIDQNGYYGEQLGRYVSSAIAPTQKAVELALEVLGGSSTVGDARKFYNPRLQDQLFRARKVTKDAAGIDAAWRAEGWTPIPTPPGVDASILRLYRRGKTSDNNVAIASPGEGGVVVAMLMTYGALRIGGIL